MPLFPGGIFFPKKIKNLEKPVDKMILISYNTHRATERYGMKINKILNMNSHEKYVEIETEYLNQEQIEIFKNGFEWFLANYKFLL